MISPHPLDQAERDLAKASHEGDWRFKSGLCGLVVVIGRVSARDWVGSLVITLVIFGLAIWS